MDAPLNDPRLPATFWFRVVPHPVTKCWLWVGSLYKNGYGCWYSGDPKATRYAHRASYEGLIGPIPRGLQVDHLCRVRHCVNPSHLEAVTVRENVVRGDAPRLLGERQRAKAHCPMGHAYDEENTVRTKAGGRMCRICRRARDRIRRGYTGLGRWPGRGDEA